MRPDPLNAVGRVIDPLLRRGTTALLARRPEVDATATALVAVDGDALEEKDPAAAARLRELIDQYREAGALIAHYAPDITGSAGGGEPGGSGAEAVKSDLVLPTSEALSALRAGDLAGQLRDRSIQRVLVAGFATNVAVDSTARHATELDFETKVIADCCAAATPEEHRASVTTTLPRVCHGVWSSGDAGQALRSER